MKRLALILCAALILVLFAGCGTTATEASPSPAESAAPSETAKTLEGKTLCCYQDAALLPLNLDFEQYPI